MNHATLEKNIGLMAVLSVIAISFGGLAEIVPLMFQAQVIEPVPGLKPYPPLQVAGRDIYIREGCYNCHSQMIRPFVDEVVRYGEYSKPGEFVYDHPFQWGSRRIGPDLAREGAKPDGPRSNLWHERHLTDPRSTSPGSIMPSYAFLGRDTIDWDSISSRIGAMVTLGVPYDEEARAHGADEARAQARKIADDIAAQGGPTDLADKEVVAVIAYLQRLGTDIKARPPTTAGADPPAAAPAVATHGGK